MAKNKTTGKRGRPAKNAASTKKTAQKAPQKDNKAKKKETVKKEVAPEYAANHIFRIEQQDLGDKKVIPLNEGGFNIGLGFYIQRVSALEFKTWGKLANGAPYESPIKFMDMKGADAVFEELLEIVKARKTPGEKIDQETPIEKFEAAAPTQDEAVTSENIDKLEKELPDAPNEKEVKKQPENSNVPNPQLNNVPTHHNIAPNMTQFGGGIQSQSHQDKNQTLKEGLKAYAEDVENMINGTFQVRVRGSITVQELSDFVNNQLIKAYEPKLLETDGKYFVTLKHEDKTIRIPEDENKYLPVKG